MKLPFLLIILLFTFCCDVAYGAKETKIDARNQLTLWVHKKNSKILECASQPYSPMSELAEFTTTTNTAKQPTTMVGVQKKMLQTIFEVGARGAKKGAGFLLDVGVPATALIAVVIPAGVAIIIGTATTPPGIVFWATMLAVVAPFVAMKDTNFVQQRILGNPSEASEVADAFKNKMNSMLRETTKTFNNLKLYVDDVAIRGTRNNLEIAVQIDNNEFYGMVAPRKGKEGEWFTKLETMCDTGLKQYPTYMRSWDDKNMKMRSVNNGHVLDARDLETTLYYFTGWAGLRLAQLNIITIEYEVRLMKLQATDKAYREAKLDYTMWANKMYSWAIIYGKYVRGAEESINAYHKYHAGQRTCVDRPDALDNIKCSKMPDIKFTKWYGKTKTTDFVEECTCQVDKFTGKMCTAVVQVLKGDKPDTSKKNEYKNTLIHGNANKKGETYKKGGKKTEAAYSEAADLYAQNLLGVESEKYGTEASNAVRTFWTDQLADFKTCFTAAENYIKTIAIEKFKIKVVFSNHPV